ncbi:MAG: competence protein CoiA family protein [Candidatus Riflebacteria bacterium]|nr:competence protein CoiA family protein [Candidatus Riflebacteria bacterium]
MFFALDENGHRIEAIEANRETQYRCPVCNSTVILRSGLQKVDHFAHTANECADSWHYDMSEWHIAMQSLFPADTREVVVKYRGSTHRADILINNTVIEMQHSPITAEEFNDRNEFFRGLGYRVCWVFDVRDKWENGQIQYLNEDTDTKMKWSHPMRVFEVLDKRLSNYDKTFAIYLHLYDEEFDDEAPYIYRVVWTKGNDDDAVDFSRFAISEEGIDMSDVKSPDKFFISLKEERKKEYVRKQIDKFKQEAATKGFSYSVKYIGKKGKPQSAYTCERRNKFGLKTYGESACCYCKYCAMTVDKKENGKSMQAVYCCYPYAYREADKDAHPGFECCYAVQLTL